MLGVPVSATTLNGSGFYHVLLNPSGFTPSFSKLHLCVVSSYNPFKENQQYIIRNLFEVYFGYVGFIFCIHMKPVPSHGSLFKTILFFLDFFKPFDDSLFHDYLLV